MCWNPVVSSNRRSRLPSSWYSIHATVTDSMWRHRVNKFKCHRLAHVSHLYHSIMTVWIGRLSVRATHVTSPCEQVQMSLLGTRFTSVSYMTVYSLEESRNGKCSDCRQFIAYTVRLCMQICCSMYSTYYYNMHKVWNSCDRTMQDHSLLWGIAWMVISFLRSIEWMVLEVIFFGTLKKIT